MERFFLASTYTLPQLFWSFIGGVCVALVVIFLFHQIIILVDRYNRTLPIIYEENGRKIKIPQNQFEKLPAAVMRDLFKRMSESSLPVQNVVVEEDSVEESTDAIALPVIDKGHVLVVGETGSGKTTAMQAIIRSRNNVVVLDPHDSPGDWGNIRVIGTGRNFAAIQDYIAIMQNELKNRFDQRGKGRRNFEPLTVVTDEMPAIVAAIGKDFGIVWRSWIREGRKVGLFIIMGSQSTRVETIGIKGEGDLLENFNYIITLGKQAQTSYRGLTDGMERPAVIHSVDGVFPVTIPYTPIVNYHQSLYVAQQPIEDIDSEWGKITSDQIRDILRMNREGESGNKIQETVFGYSGGHAFNRLKLVLEKHAST